MKNVKELSFTEPDRLKQPVGGLIVEAPQEQDHVLGGTVSGPDFEVVCPDGQWSAFAPDAEIQRGRDGDTFMCVSYSHQNAIEFILRRQYGESINLSDTFLGVGSGTKRGQGNSKRAVAEWHRLNGFVLEGDRPFTQSMSIDDAYKPNTPELLAKGIKNLDGYEFFYKWLADNSAQTIKAGLTFSPVQVDVLASYKTNGKGYVVWDANNPTYAHEVIIFGYEEGVCWHVFDSETSQFLKFDWHYPFGAPMAHAVKKKSRMELLKKKGQSGIAVKHVSEPSLIVFSGGSVVGENLFKSIYGVTSFSQLPIMEVNEWPYPIRHILNCSLFTA